MGGFFLDGRKRWKQQKTDQKGEEQVRNYNKQIRNNEEQGKQPTNNKENKDNKKTTNDSNDKG